MDRSPGASTTLESISSSQTSSRVPVMYSAIGSLEDPASRSLPRQRNHAINNNNNNNNSNTDKPFQLPSNVMLPPLNLIYQHSLIKEGGDISSSLQQIREQQPLVGDNTPIILCGKPSSLSAKMTAFENEALSLAYESSSALTTEKNDPYAMLGGLLPSTGGGGDSISTNDTSTNSQNAVRRSSMRAAARRDDHNTSIENSNQRKKVTIADSLANHAVTKKKKKQRPVEMFRPSSDAYTPRMGKKDLKYKPAEMRTPVQKMASPMGTLSRPNFRDALRRVAMIIHQHIIKIERRFEQHHQTRDDSLFLSSMRDAFSEDCFVSPKYKLTMVRVPMAIPSTVFGLKRIRPRYEIPSEKEIYEFAHQLFDSVHLSSECSIVCLIYMERLMEHAKVPLLACSWRPIFMCGLLLASKVWQDLSSWNIEFASVYPQYPLDAINRLEVSVNKLCAVIVYLESTSFSQCISAPISKNGQVGLVYLQQLVCKILFCVAIRCGEAWLSESIQPHGSWSRQCASVGSSQSRREEYASERRGTIAIEQVDVMFVCSS